MKVLLAGDTHGNLAHLQYLLARALDRGCREIWVLGDFGYWEHMPDGGRFLDSLSAALATVEMPLYWIRGNHDNIDYLEREYLVVGPTEIRPYVMFWPDAWVRELAGLRVMACGGAHSIDKASRVQRAAPGVLWFPGEGVSEGQVEACVAQGRVEVLLTHDAPFGVEVLEHLGHHAEDVDLFPESTLYRRRLTRVVEETKPALVAHGHHHLFHDSVLSTGTGCRVLGLAADVSSGPLRESWAVLDVLQFSAAIHVTAGATLRGGRQ